MQLDSPFAKSTESSNQPKRNWPLIWAAVAVACISAVCVLGAVALYVTNFNLLEWME